MLKKIRLYIVPFLSIVIILFFLFFFKTPETPTGLTALDITEERTITAKVTLKLSKNELIPEDSLVIVMLDDKETSMPIKQFIELSQQPYEYIQGKQPIASYEGYGYIGDYTYSIDLSNFDLDRKVLSGDHKFTTKIIYKEKVLYEKKNPFTVENAWYYSPNNRKSKKEKW